MSLYRVNSRLAAMVRVLSEGVLEEGMAIGQTVENDHIRAHRFANSIRVTDLTNAGKRGKTVDEFAFYDLDYVKHPRILKMIEQFAAAVPRATSYKKLFAMAKGINKEAERLGDAGERVGLEPKIETYTKKGVRVAAPGVKEIVINTRNLVGRAAHDGFSVRDRMDMDRTVGKEFIPGNEQTIMTPMRGKVTAAKKFYAWVKKNERKLAGMTFDDLQRALRKAKIDYHYYLGMD